MAGRFNLVGLRPERVRIECARLFHVIARQAVSLSLSKARSSETLKYSSSQTEPVEVPVEVPSFREDWPFLRDPSCPPELKILAANKITAWQNYTQGHEKLFDCTSLQEQFAAVKFTVENYIENRAIIREFEFYKEHKTCLAEHPVFDELKQIRKLRKMKVIDLIRLQEKLQHNIWRIKSEIKKKNKPHLDVERERSIQEKNNQLAEIERILKEYE